MDKACEYSIIPGVHLTDPILDAAQPDKYVLTAKPYSAENQIGVTANGWTYSIPTDMAWRDAAGAFRESGRPDCLPPSFKEVPRVIDMLDAALEMPSHEDEDG